MRLLKQASHGTVEIGRGLGFTDYSRRDRRYIRNLALREGCRIGYTLAENFTREDAAEIELFSASGD